MMVRSPNSLGHQFDVGSFAAPGAGAGELEQRFEHLGPLDGDRVDLRPVHLRDFEEELEVLALLGDVFDLRPHVDRLVPHDLLALGRAHVNAHAASGAVLRGDLDGHLLAGELATTPVLGWESGRAPSRAPPGRRPSSGWPHGGRPWHIWRSRCRCRDPRSVSPRRSNASPTGSFRSGTSRRPAVHSPGSRSPFPSIIRAGDPLDEVRCVVGNQLVAVGLRRDRRRHRRPGAAPPGRRRRPRSCARGRYRRTFRSSCRWPS